MVQIALGIVLAVVILAFLPTIIGASVVILGLALIAVFVVVLIAWFSTDPVTAILTAVVVASVVAFFRYMNKADEIRYFEDAINKRRKMGYDTTELEEAFRQFKLSGEIKREGERRRELGYRDSD